MASKHENIQYYLNRYWLSATVLVYWVGFGCNLGSGTGNGRSLLLAV